MEDFGYVKDEGKSKFPHLLKRFFLIIAVLFSFVCFAYITVSAYYSSSQGGKEIEVIKSPEGQIKVIEEEQNSDSIGMKVDRSIYEDIFGNKKESLKLAAPKIRLDADPVLPPQQKVKENVAPAVKKEEDKKIIVYTDQPKSEKGFKEVLGVKETYPDKNRTTVKIVTATGSENKKRLIRVQIAALTSKKSAEEYWNQLHRLHSELFSGLKSFIEEVNLGKRGIFYRLQIGNFFNQIEADDFCDRYVSQAQKSRADCIVVE